MSRIAKYPVAIPQGVIVDINGMDLSVKGPNGTLALNFGSHVDVTREESSLRVLKRGNDSAAKAMVGTIRALLNNMVFGVSKGFERRLQLVGVGYRAQLQGRTLNLTLGFSHPIAFDAPEGITIETPSQTEVVIRGADKQQVGQVAANIRSFRPPEPYKGKGVRYADERVSLKEAKKK